MKSLDYRWRLVRLCAVLLGWAFFSLVDADAASTLRVLFLGDEGHHRPADQFKQLQPVLAKKGIDLAYTNKLEDLSAEKLAGYDALAIYATAFRRAVSRKKAALCLGIRFWLVKSTYTSPKRLP